VSNDPLDSFVVNRPAAPDADDMPSVTVEPGRDGNSTNRPRPAARRSPPTVDFDQDGRKPVKADAPTATITSRDVAEKPEPRAEGSKPAGEPADKKPQPMASDDDATPSYKAADAKPKSRLSRGTRFGVYLGLIVATVIFIGVAGNAMLQSAESWRSTISE